MNKTVCLGFPIVEPSKILLYEFWYDFVKPKYHENAKLYMDTNSFIVYIKTWYLWRYCRSIEARFDNSNYELVSNWINGRSVDGKAMTKFVRLRAKT